MPGITESCHPKRRAGFFVEDEILGVAHDAPNILILNTRSSRNYRMMIHGRIVFGNIQTKTHCQNSPVLLKPTPYFLPGRH